MQTTFPMPAPRAESPTGDPVDYGLVGRPEKTPMTIRDAAILLAICACSATLMIYTATMAAALAVDYFRGTH